MSQFTIGTPCNENWDAMSTAQKGRFCDVCAKCVVDLTGKSQPEIKKIYDEANGDLCGRMPVAEIKSRERATKNNILTFKGLADAASMRKLRQFAAAFVMAFSFLFGSAAYSQNQSIKMGKIAYHPPVTQTGNLGGSVTLSDNSKLSGIMAVQITPENGEGVTYDLDGLDGDFFQRNLKTGVYLVEAWQGHRYGSAKIAIRQGQTASVHIVLSERMLMGDTIWIPSDDINQPSELIQPIINQVVENINLIDPEGENELESPEKSVESTVLEAGNESESITNDDIRLVVFPNPGKQVFHVRVDNAKLTEALIMVNDMQGKTVWQQSRSISAAEIDLDLSNLPAGPYLLSVVSGKTKITKKLIIE